MNFHVPICWNRAVWAKLDRIVLDNFGHLNHRLAELNNLRRRSEGYTWYLYLSRLVASRHDSPAKPKPRLKLHISWVSFLVLMIDRRKLLCLSVESVPQGTWHIRQHLLLGNSLILVERGVLPRWMRQLHFCIFLVCYLNYMPLFQLLAFLKVFNLLLDALATSFSLLFVLFNRSIMLVNTVMACLTDAFLLQYTLDALWTLAQYCVIWDRQNVLDLWLIRSRPKLQSLFIWHYLNSWKLICCTVKVLSFLLIKVQRLLSKCCIHVWNCAIFRCMQGLPFLQQPIEFSHPFFTHIFHWGQVLGIIDICESYLLLFRIVAHYVGVFVLQKLLKIRRSICRGCSRNNRDIFDNRQRLGLEVWCWLLCQRWIHQPWCWWFSVIVLQNLNHVIAQISESLSVDAVIKLWCSVVQSGLQGLLTWARLQLLDAYSAVMKLMLICKRCFKFWELASDDLIILFKVGVIIGWLL